MSQQLSYLVVFVAVAGALVLGVGLVLAVARVTQGPSPNARLNGKRQVGCWGRVVATIPCAGVGLVRVAGKLVATGVPARSPQGGLIEVGEAVVVVDVSDGVLEVAAVCDAPLLFTAESVAAGSTRRG